MEAVQDISSSLPAQSGGKQGGCSACERREEQAAGRQVCLGSGRGETKHPLLGQQSPAKREKGRLEEAAFNLQECGEGW